ncbi:hypothetical protein Tco_1522143 [Tanacetum coccineum]
MSFGVPRIINLHLFDGYGFEDTLREMMKFEYIYEGDGDTFVDYSWERALSIDNEIYPEWLLEFFSTLYFDKDVDRNNLMKEKLEVNDKQFDHKDYWTRVGKPTLTKHKEVLVKEPLMQIVHKVIMGSLVHRISKMLADEPGNFAYPTYEPPNVPPYLYPYIPYPYPYMHYPNSGNQSNQRVSYELGDDDYFTSAMPDFGGSSSGYAVGSSFRGAGFNDDDDMDE